MAVDGHAPTLGAARVLNLLGEGVCPQCRDETWSIDATPNLRATKTGKYRCPKCGATYPVARVNGGSTE